MTNISSKYLKVKDYEQNIIVLEVVNGDSKTEQVSSKAN